MIIDPERFKKHNLRWEPKTMQGDPARPKPGSVIPCAICQKPFQVPYYIGSVDPICGECFKAYRETATLVCQKCGAVVGRIAPKMLDCGFYVRPRMRLHTDQCGMCREDIVESTIVEVKEWIARHRRPVIYTSGGTVYKPKDRK